MKESLSGFFRISNGRNVHSKVLPARIIDCLLVGQWQNHSCSRTIIELVNMIECSMSVRFAEVRVCPGRNNANLPRVRLSVKGHLSTR